MNIKYHKFFESGWYLAILVLAVCVGAFGAMYWVLSALAKCSS